MTDPARRSPVCRDGCYMPHLCAGSAAACLMRPKSYYPMYADLNGRPCVVIGGGLIAQRKVTTLLSYGASLTVISPAVTRSIAAHARAGRIRHTARTFRSGDLAGAWLVYAATDDAAINQAVYREARRRRIFTNVVDQTPLCSFIAPAIFRRGGITVAVSTAGASPSLAKRLRDDIGRLVGDEYRPMLDLLTGLRGRAKRTLPKYQDRKRYFGELVGGRVFALVRRGQADRARREALAILKRHAANGNGH